MEHLLPYLLPSVMIVAAAMAALAFGISRRRDPTGGTRPAHGHASERDSCRLCGSPCDEDVAGSSTQNGGNSR